MVLALQQRCTDLRHCQGSSAAAGVVTCVICITTLLHIADGCKIKQDRCNNRPCTVHPQIWPFYRNISAYPLYTQNVKATCASKGCNPAFPQPGDVLTVRVQVFPGSKVPRTFIPGVVVSGCQAMCSMKASSVRLAWHSMFSD